ncbi:Fungal specific transcription factor [Metarhizium guizhouense ARSEF 977]|uniref:Fungal specific transcription factor n=1 Tax=Metarhizium guizhouense (strain ARSEF 977) TaxID=1276136 RepID=A0A0B4GXX3_METGA|nr:Fungal specific transcription factor [Metarhizium guizhouense ARSEF 977]
MGETESPKDTTHHRSACTECQRRKQKCNREWPCNHCQKRKVADKCRFGQSQPSQDKAPRHDFTRKRQLSHEDTESMDSNPWEDADSGFEALGYSASHLFAGLSASSTHVPKTFRQYYMDPSSCPQLKRALLRLPPRPYTDALVQNFLNHVNFHYYIIYPPSFLEEYKTWWSLRSENRPLGMQWTCLLLMVCACSTQYTDSDLERKLEIDLGQSAQELTEQYHNAARELHGAIPVGNNHLLNVQSLLHSCYWYKSEARFVECWHVLSTAIREAQELGIHKETVSGQMSEFDREMRRRIWCILDTWDWQISALLSRPVLIDRTDIDVGLPSLTLEGYTPSPLQHMKLQSELITQLFNRFGLPKDVSQHSDVRAYQAIVDRWMNAFPSTYAFIDPDTSNDASRPWIVLHRHYLHTMAMSMMLDPIRAYLARPMSKQSPPDELKIRDDGVDYSLRLLDALHGFFGHVYPRDAKFHFVLFCIFDTAAVLCSALMHDQDSSLSKRDDMLVAVDKALSMLKRLNTVTKTARTSYKVLAKIAQNISRPGQEVKSPIMPAKKRPKGKELALTPPCMNQTEVAFASDPGSVDSHASYTTPPSDAQFYGAPASQSTPPGHYFNVDESAGCAPPVPPTSPGAAMSSSNTLHYNGAQLDYSTSYVNMTPPTDEAYHAIDYGNFGAITEQDLGDLATLWNYESLNLDFINPGSVS